MRCFLLEHESFTAFIYSELYIFPQRLFPVLQPFSPNQQWGEGSYSLSRLVSNTLRHSGCLLSFSLCFVHTVCYLLTNCLMLRNISCVFASQMLWHTFSNFIVIKSLHPYTASYWSQRSVILSLWSKQQWCGDRCCKRGKLCTHTSV